MSKKRVQLLRNYVYGTNRIDKINNGRLLVEEYGFKPKTFNDGTQFEWKELTYIFSFFPVKEQMVISDLTVEGTTQTCYGPASIAKALEKYETLLFKEE